MVSTRDDELQEVYKATENKGTISSEGPQSLLPIFKGVVNQGRVPCVVGGHRRVPQTFLPSPKILGGPNSLILRFHKAKSLRLSGSACQSLML